MKIQKELLCRFLILTTFSLLFPVVVYAASDPTIHVLDPTTLDIDNSAAAKLNSAMVCMHKKKWREAAELYSAVIKENSHLPAYCYRNTGLAYFNLGNQDKKKEDWEKAASYYTIAIAKDPDSPGLTYARAGMAYLELRDYQQAARYLDIYLTKNPEASALVYADAAMAHLGSGDPVKAHQYYLEAIKKDPTGLPEGVYRNAQVAQLMTEKRL